jgi:hypothetical protein
MEEESSRLSIAYARWAQRHKETRWRQRSRYRDVIESGRTFIGVLFLVGVSGPRVRLDGIRGDAEKADDAGSDVEAAHRAKHAGAADLYEIPITLPLAPPRKNTA